MTRNHTHSEPRISRSAGSKTSNRGSVGLEPRIEELEESVTCLHLKLSSFVDRFDREIASSKEEKEVTINALKADAVAFRGELKDFSTKLASIDKAAALTDQKVVELSSSFTSFKTESKAEFKEIRDSISSLKTTVAWAGGAVAAFGFVIGIGLMILRAFFK